MNYGPTPSCSLPRYTPEEVLSPALNEEKTFSLSEEDAKRSKYLVGCNIEGWNSFILRENYFFLSALRDREGWQELPDAFVSTPKELLQDKHRPLALMVCFHALKSYPNYPLNQLRQLGTLVIHYTDDLQDHNMYEKEFLLSELLLKTDIILNTYAYRIHEFLAPLTREFHQRWPDRALPKRLWHPHSAINDFTDQNLNPNPEKKIFLSGAHARLTYPLRYWFRNTYKWSFKMVKYGHPGFFNLKKAHTLDYAQAINTHEVAFTSTSAFRYLVAKVFEIPATGTLLLVNLDLQHVFEALGLINMVHYVGYNDDNPTPMINWVLDPSNSLQISRIRKQGQEAVRSKHTPILRAKALNDYIIKRKITYVVPSMTLEQCPCPVAGIDDFEECVRNYYLVAYVRPGTAKPYTG